MGNHVDKFVLSLLLLGSPFERYVFSSELCEWCSDDTKIGAEHAMVVTFLGL